MPLLVPRTFLTLQCPLPCAYGQRMLTTLSTLPGKHLCACQLCVRAQPASLSALACPSRCKSSWSLQSEQSLVKHRSYYRVAQTHNQTALRQTAPPCQPHQQQRLLQPPVGQAGSTNQPQSTRKCLQEPLRRLNEPPQPLSLQLLSLNVNGLRERQKPAADRNSFSRPLFGLKPG